MNVQEFHSRRQFANLPEGRIAYVEDGQGPVTLFVHGVPLNGFHWRHVIAGLADMRRCIAPDLMGLGYSEIGETQDVSFTAQATMLRRFIDSLGIDRIDLVGNDSGGAIAQIFAANNPERLRSLTLTNCDVHDGWPPKLILPMIQSAREGTLADFWQTLLDHPDTARTRMARSFADPSVLTDEVIRVYLQPLLSSPQRRDAFHRYWMGFDPKHTVAIETGLRALNVPTLIVWGLDDVFFDLQWAHWLRDTIRGAATIVEVPDAKLFFPEDRPHTLIGPLRRHLQSIPGA